MASQDKGTGLLSKVARFVLNPTVDWVDIDKPGTPREADRSKQALKQMIERKQYNDAVRKREFDKLRKLRRSNVPIIAGATVPASTFQDSWGYSVFEERANTLKKIDEIEAQMSKQWWKGRDPAAGGSAQGSTAPTLPPPEIVAEDSAFATTMPSDLVDSQDDLLTQAGTSAGLAAPAPVQPDQSGSARTVAGTFSVPLAAPVESGTSLADTRLEEAAIRFANSDDGGAEAVLLTAWQTPGVAAELASTWASALLDLYRATGRQASFEQMAADYAQRFDGSTPVWAAARPDSGRISGPAAAPPAGTATGPHVWRCPAQLDAASVLHLQALIQGSSEPWWLDWRLLKTITPQAAEILAALMAHWCEQPLRLYLEGIEVLEHLLRLRTPMGDSVVEQCWWRLRLDLMRILRLQDDYELVALDFCVTYEVSPPAWRAARCRRLDAAGLQAAPGQLADSARLPVLPLSTPAGNQPLAFKGEVLGDASEVLQSLQAAMPADKLLVISCTDLIRVDFSAAGSILNWMANAQAQGGRIELHDVPQLVAVFFQLIGINEHARIINRTY
ncbi:MAG: STAS domain-containing protein [Rhodoferax sp.]